MLPAQHRLRRADEITHVLRRGHARLMNQVRVSALPVSALNSSRVACVVGKKVSRLAVQRHKYQRWLRVVAAELIKNTPKSFDIVFVAQPGIVQYERFSSFKADFLTAAQAFLNKI